MFTVVIETGLFQDARLILTRRRFPVVTAEGGTSHLLKRALQKVSFETCVVGHHHNGNDDNSLLAGLVNVGYLRKIEDIRFISSE
jgi:hypothetical protein